MDEFIPEHRPAWPPEAQLQVETLGPPRHPSPIPSHREIFVEDDERVLLCSEASELEPFLRGEGTPPSLERAGPRARVFFDPATVGCGILTCGGLCPGLNNVVRSLVLRLTYAYGVERIIGFRYGYRGLARPEDLPPVPLTPDVVERLHEHGGTFLGSSRGPQDPASMVDQLERLQLGILFVIGGDGGLRGASALAAEIRRRGLEIAVVGIPKTIDNDIQWTARSFGFDTAVQAATGVIRNAHVEAQGFYDGIALVRLMGRQSGFIAAHATLATSDVNFCLVPEVPFDLEGPGGFLEALEARLEARDHAVIVAAEGAGQELIFPDGTPDHDASGNVRLGDIGIFLRDRIRAHLAARGVEAPVRYIDPSYLIRSQPANALDAQLCLVLGQHAVHAAMAGRTNLFIGIWNQRMTHVPIPLGIAERKRLRPDGDTWQRVLEATGQPDFRRED
ncbi:MAG: ATP-dependent 6-phosphofructokinase [Acidobacteriota bacterium]|jgi:6-phosphofructokinase 1